MYLLTRIELKSTHNSLFTICSTLDKVLEGWIGWGVMDMVTLLYAYGWSPNKAISGEFLELDMGENVICDKSFLSSCKSNLASMSFLKSTLTVIGGWFRGSNDLLVTEDGGGLETMLARWDSAFLRNLTTASIAADVWVLSADEKSKLSRRLGILFIVDNITV